MNRTLLAVGLAALVALGGCAALSGADQADVDSGIALGDDSPGATGVTQSIGIDVADDAAGEELSAVGATYPRDHFAVDGAKHEAVGLGVDTDGDGEAERTFDADQVSGVNNNDYSFDVTLDTDYTLQSGDTVLVEYPAVDNPSEPGEYTVAVRLNDRPTANETVQIG